MIFPSPQNPTSRAFLTLGNHVLSLSDTTKFLGVVSDKNLKLNYPVHSLLKNVNFRIHALSKHSLIFPHALFFHYTVHLFIVIFRSAFHRGAIHMLCISNLFKSFKIRHSESLILILFGLISCTSRLT